MAISVDEFILKPNCSFTNILLILTLPYSLLHIIFSIILEKEVSREMGL